ncbi:helix-turn-helix domain-containing protein [Streptomyces sp. NPDC004376]
MATRDLSRLATRVRAHRMQRYNSRLAAAQAAGISKDTWMRVEEGREDVRESTYVKIERALGWAPDSWRAVAEGGEPTLTGKTAPAIAGVSSVKTLTAEEARQAVLDAARAAMPDAPLRELDAFGDELVEILRRAGHVADEP